MNNETMTIEVNVGNLSEDERNQFRALIDKANMPPPKAWWEGTEFDIKPNDEYYYITGYGNITARPCGNGKADDEILGYGNGCTDEAYMEQRAKEIKRSNLIANFAKVVNGDWEADWSEMGQRKYFIYYASISRQYSINHDTSYREEGVTYFKSKELAQRCIDEVILPLERGEL